MPDETVTTPAPAQVADGPAVTPTPTTAEFSPADLGIDEPVQSIPTKPATPADHQTQPKPADPASQTEPPPDDLIESALKRGRPSRTLDGLDEEEKDLFNNMSRKAYDKLYPWYLKAKPYISELDQIPALKEKLATLEAAAKTPKEASYFDHEDSYLLSQSYRDGLVERNRLTNLASFWEDQLVAIEEGKPFVGLQQTADGGLQQTAPIDPSPRAKAQVLSILQEVRTAQAQQQAKLEAIKAESKQSYSRYKDGLTNAHKTIFGKYEAVLKPAAEKELEKFPEFVRGRPEVQSLAYALALINHIVKTDAANQKSSVAADANRRNGQVAGPTMKEITTSPRPAPVADEQEYKSFKAAMGL